MNRQHGVALITALLVVALATIAATALLAASSTSIQRTATLTDSERAFWYADGLEAWGKSILERDRKEGETDDLTEIWAQQAPPLPVEGGALRGKLNDLQGRYNLNNLADPDPNKVKIYQAQLTRLFGCIEDLDSFAAADLANAIKDWVDADDEVSFPGGAEDLNYLSLIPPYRAANRRMNSVSELMAVQGMTRKIYAAIVEHLSALPVTTAINLNTATEPVLCSLSEDSQTRQKLVAFAESRKEQPLEAIEPFYSETFDAAAVPPDMLSVSTHWFEGRAEAFIGSGRVVLYSLINRPDQGAPKVLGRSLDTE